jgi:hypothetical protein
MPTNDKEELEAYLRLTGLPGVRVSKPFCFCFVFLLVSFEGLSFSCQLPGASKCSFRSITKEERQTDKQ